MKYHKETFTDRVACRNRSCVLMDQGWNRQGIREGFWMTREGYTPIALLFPMDID